MYTYIVDIDNTIFSTNGSDYENSLPLFNRIKIINNLYDSGHKIIYWTARGGKSGTDWRDFTEKQLKLYGVKYSELRMNKPSYDLWIDDRALNSEEFFSEKIISTDRSTINK